MSNFISQEKARTMMATYKEVKKEILGPEHAHVLPECETFDRSQFDAVLAIPGCTGIRIYYGMNEDHVVHSIIVGVNANGDNLLTLPTAVNSISISITNTGSGTTDTTTTSSDSSAIIEDGVTCPPTCPTTGI